MMGVAKLVQCKWPRYMVRAACNYDGCSKLVQCKWPRYMVRAASSYDGQSAHGNSNEE